MKKEKHKVLETQKHEHPKTHSYIPFLDKVDCIQDVSTGFTTNDGDGYFVTSKKTRYCFRIFVLCGVHASAKIYLKKK